MIEALLPFEKIERKVHVKIQAKTSPKYGCRPSERTPEELIDYGIVNIDKPKGPSSHQVSSYVQNILEISKSIFPECAYTLQEYHNKHEAEILKLDSEKAKKHLGWNSKYNISEALDSTLNWYKHFYEGDTNMLKYTENEINSYLQK